MGTRSLTHFIEVNDGKEETLTTLYRQYDGHPESIGLELATFLESGLMVNGYGMTDKRQFNGLGCLVAQVIAELKDGVANVYVYPPDSKNSHIKSSKMV